LTSAPFRGKRPALVGNARQLDICARAKEQRKMNAEVSAFDIG